MFSFTISPPKPRRSTRYRWRNGTGATSYVSSTHMPLPQGLNYVYDEWGGEKASGVLLHTKFLDTFPQKA